MLLNQMANKLTQTIIGMYVFSKKNTVLLVAMQNFSDRTMILNKSLEFLAPHICLLLFLEQFAVHCRDCVILFSAILLSVC